MREYKDVVTPVDLIPYIYTQSTLQHTGSEKDTMLRIKYFTATLFQPKATQKPVYTVSHVISSCPCLPVLPPSKAWSSLQDLDLSGVCCACFPVVCGLCCASTPQHSSVELWDAYSVLGFLNDVGDCTCTQNALKLLLLILKRSIQ